MSKNTLRDAMLVILRPSAEPKDKSQVRMTWNLNYKRQGFGCAIQDGVLNTKNCKKSNLKENINVTSPVTIDDI